MDINYVQHTIRKIYLLLTLGVWKVADDINSNESIIMRTACDLLQGLNKHIEKGGK